MCAHLPSIWAEFLTTIPAANTSGSTDGPKASGHKTYRQSLLEPVPVTAWLLAGWPLRDRGQGSASSKSRVPVTWQPNLEKSLGAPPILPEPFQLLIDVDSSRNPLTLYHDEHCRLVLLFSVQHTYVWNVIRVKDAERLVEIDHF